MDVSLETIQALAPDQASINAAKKLLSSSKWPLRGKNASVNIIWGHCQGSGSKPYMTMADVVDHGYKCTCPSRKFPCKHVLALMWQFSDNSGGFIEGEAPEWVQEWLGRRKKKNSDAEKSPKEQSNPDTKKNISLDAVEPEKQLSPEELEKRIAANAKRAAQNKEKTEASVSAGLEELTQWIGDQLRTGLGGFLKESTERCRRIASRLVDAKAANLASRLDELPARLLPLGMEQQSHVAFKELGQLVVLCEAWKVNPNDPDVRRAIITTENRDAILENPDTFKLKGLWQVVGEKVFTRRDGLISHSTWLLLLDAQHAAAPNNPQLALLQDYYPAAAGSRSSTPAIGTCFYARCHFYPSRVPLRALISEQEYPEPPPQIKWPTEREFWSCYARAFTQQPWGEVFPVVIDTGKIGHDKSGALWWQASSSTLNLPLHNDVLPEFLPGCEIDSAFLLWNGHRAELYSVMTKNWGLVACPN